MKSNWKTRDTAKAVIKLAEYGVYCSNTLKFVDP